MIPCNLRVPLAMALILATHAAAQGGFQQRVSASTGPQRFQSPIVIGDTIQRLNGTFFVPRFDPQGRTLRAITAEFQNSAAVSATAFPLSGSAFEGVNLNVTVAASTTPPGAAVLQPSLFFNATQNVGNPPAPRLDFNFGRRSTTAGPGAVAAASFANFVGASSLAIPFQAQFDLNAFSSRTGTTIRRQYTIDYEFTLSVTYDWTPSAAISSFGSGCPGSSGVPTQSSIGGLPNPGNAAFGFAVGRALANAPALLLLNVRSDLTLGGTCTIHPLLPASDLPTTIDATGRGTVAAPIPNDPGLLGVGFVTQWAILDPAGIPIAGLGNWAFSDGLQVLIGL